ncbi:hypothetical protein [Achromobacter phage Motura]|uniref:Uncharacterized protein n=1 Tax=Achromobacter phage Motura TaxID=2591403 RepID=A0A514CT05_9CAUD|nr:hypothetical protein H1O15_gp171 [Achromobacter phage Motura]QDH83617.1 hypothetical protein [Achromobacter phage Motura]
MRIQARARLKASAVNEVHDILNAAGLAAEVSSQGLAIDNDPDDVERAITALEAEGAIVEQDSETCWCVTMPSTPDKVYFYTVGNPG